MSAVSTNLYGTSLLVTDLQIDDVQKRFSIFYLFGCVASALAGVLAYGLSQMDGIQGIQGWRWIFIMEGVVRQPLSQIDWQKFWHALSCRVPLGFSLSFSWSISQTEPINHGDSLARRSAPLLSDESIETERMEMQSLSAWKDS